MKVAIIGAGLSGLACALELKRNGILPSIFEARSKVGDALCKNCISLRMLSRPLIDYFHYFEKKYKLDLKPLYPINKMILHSPRKTVNIAGKLGFSVKRGTDAFSIENQIAAKTGLDILFDRYMEISELINDFDKIVVATGNNVIPEKLGAWSDTFVAMTRYALVLGEFDTGTVKVWFNTKYSKNAFCYMVPTSPKEASIVLIMNNITKDEVDFYWNEFLEIERINNPIIEMKDGEHKCGKVHPYNMGKVYFTGNAAGFTDDFVGFGAFNAIESGILAARAIVENLDYNKLVLPISKNVAAIHEYRKVVNLFDNSDYNRLISFLKFPLIKYFIYNNPLLRISHGSHIVRTLNNVFQKKD